MLTTDKTRLHLFVGTRAPRIVAEPFTAKKTLKRKVDILFSGEELAFEFFQPERMDPIGGK